MGTIGGNLCAAGEMALNGRKVELAHFGGADLDNVPSLKIAHKLGRSSDWKAKIGYGAMPWMPN